MLKSRTTHKNMSAADAAGLPDAAAEGGFTDAATVLGNSRSAAAVMPAERAPCRILPNTSRCSFRFICLAAAMT